MAKKKMNSVENTLNKLYENDTTLNYLKQYQEERNKLLNSAWDNNISLKSEKLKDSLSNSYIKNAFSNIEDYKKYSEPILNTINTHDYDTLQKLIAEPFSINLKNDYAQALKATDIFSNSLDKISDLGLAKSSYYDRKLNESISQYKTDKIKASKNLLDLAYSINNDSFESKISKSVGIGSLSKALESAYSPKAVTTSEILSNNKVGGVLSEAFSSLNTPVSKQIGLGSLDSVLSKNTGLASMSKALESAYSPKAVTTSEILSNNKVGGALSEAFSSLNTPVSKQIGLGSIRLEEKVKSLFSENKTKSIEIDNISVKPPIDFKPIEIPRIQDSPMYKQNEKLIDKTEKQIEVIEEMSKYLIELGTKQESQANIINKQNAEFLNNSNKQVELMDRISGFLSSQSEILELQKQNQELQREELNQQNNELLNNSHEQIKLMSEVSSFLSSQSKILEAQQENQELQNEHLKLQNEKMEEQIKDNKSSSKIALIIAWAGIIIGIISASGGMYLEHYIYKEEDKSDSINHKELKKVISSSSNKFEKELIEQLILQNQNINTINQVLKSGFINNTKIDKELLKQLKLQNKNLLKVNQYLKEESKSIK